ncbi:hypothetical protein WDW89_17845 [Deltaproteobacteria bacterium TL4]
MSRKLLAVFYGIMVLVVISGCKAQVIGLKYDKSFNYTSIQQGGIAVGGITSVMNRWSTEERMDKANQFRKYLMDVREEYPVLPATLVLGKMGEAAYHKMLDDYKEKGVLSPFWLKTLNTQVTGYKYLIFARVEADEIVRDRRVEQILDLEEKFTGEVLLKTSTTRIITIEYNVYDNQFGRLVWNGRISQSQTNKQDYQPPKEIPFAAVIPIEEEVLHKMNETLYPSPPPPKSDEVMVDVFIGFAQNMPEPEQ